MKRISKLIKFPASLVDEIESYREKNYLSFSAAVYELIRIGLDKKS